MSIGKSVMQRRFILKLAAALGAAIAVRRRGVGHADETIKVGVTGGPHAQMMEVVKTVAAKNGLNIKIVEFSDYVQPNAALAGGDLDANSYQHDPYLQAQVKDRGYKLIRIADTVTFPMGIYSKKVKSLAELQPGAKIAVPNDPTNGGRALLLLQKQGLLKLRAGRGPEGDAARYRRQPEEAEDRRTRRGADSALARRRGCRRDQHQFCDGSGAEAEAGCDRDRRPKGSVCEHHRDPRSRQGQAVGREAGRGVSLAGSEAVHRKQVRRAR